MKPSHYFAGEGITSKTIDDRKGFSLIIALVLMGMCVTLTVALVSFIGIELQLSNLSTDRGRARMNAIFAARLALAELQSRVGRDQTATFPFPPEYGLEGWVASVVTGLPGGVLAEKVPFQIAKPMPLVSGSYYLETPTKFPLGLTEISHAFSWEGHNFPAVHVPWAGFSGVSLTMSPSSTSSRFGHMDEGRFAFWVQDESLKADVGTVEAAGIAALPNVQINRQLVSSRFGIDSLWGIKRQDIQSWSEGLSQAHDWGWVELAWRVGGVYNQFFPLHSRLYTNNSRGVLSDARNGGLRINWDQRIPEKLQGEKLPTSRNVWEEFFLRTTPPLPSFTLKTCKQ